MLVGPTIDAGLGTTVTISDAVQPPELLVMVQVPTAAPVATPVMGCMVNIVGHGADQKPVGVLVYEAVAPRHILGGPAIGVGLLVTVTVAVE